MKKKYPNNVFVSSIYGTKCYPNGQEHGNIKYPEYFASLKDCLDYLNDKIVDLGDPYDSDINKPITK